MKSIHLVDPALAPILEQLEKTPLVCTQETLPTIREMLPKVMARPADPEADAAVELRELSIPGPPGAPAVRVIVYKPKAAAGHLPAILHVHGGGYVMGTPEMSDAQSKRFAHKIGCVVVSVDYRLAPETPFPGPVEDCYAALKWLYGNARDLGVDRSRIAITGESAGGGLAAALALLARDRNEVPIVLQLLTYPMIDDRTCTRSDQNPFVGEFMWTASNNYFGWEALLGGPPGSPNISPYAAPARAADLGGLPPTFIAVGALDLFVEENIGYAQRLLRAGVPTELHLYPGAFHGFPGATQAAVSIAYERDRETALKRALLPPT